MIARCGQVAELQTAGNHFDCIFHAELLVHRKTNDLFVLGQHSEVVVLVHFRVIVDEINGEHDHHQDEHYSHDDEVILLPD